MITVQPSTGNLSQDHAAYHLRNEVPLSPAPLPAPKRKVEGEEIKEIGKEISILCSPPPPICWIVGHFGSLSEICMSEVVSGYSA